MTTAAAKMYDGVRDASHLVSEPGVRDHVSWLLGTEVLCFYQVDDAEHQRRQSVGLKAVTGLAMLETLMGLPVDLPVSWRLLGQGEYAKVRALPVGTVERDGAMVIRRAVRPVRVDLAVVTARSWRRGLERAGRFAPFCRRTLLWDRRPPGTEKLSEASFYGVGVLHRTGGDVTTLLEPREYRPARHTAGAWWFTEELYQSVCSAEAPAR